MLFFGLLVFGLYPNAQGNPLSREAMILYRSFSAVVWAMCLGFLIFSCVTSFGGEIFDTGSMNRLSNLFLFLFFQSGIVNEIGSLSIWVPFSRLSYSGYLVHQLIFTFFYASLYTATVIQLELIVCILLGCYR
jgi:hypothetical protein